MFISGVNVTADKLFGGVNDTADKFIGGVVDTGDYLHEFSKKIETIPMAYSGARGTLIYEKT
jgi:hypothetical protein